MGTNISHSWWPKHGISYMWYRWANMLSPVHNPGWHTWHWIADMQFGRPRHCYRTHIYLDCSTKMVYTIFDSSADSLYSICHIDWPTHLPQNIGYFVWWANMLLWNPHWSWPMHRSQRSQFWYKWADQLWSMHSIIVQPTCVLQNMGYFVWWASTWL